MDMRWIRVPLTKISRVFKEEDGTQYEIQTAVQMVLALSKSGSSKY